MALSDRVSDLILCVVMMASAAATLAASPPPRRAYIEPQEWTAAIERRGVDPALFGNPLAATPEMRQSAKEYSGDGDDIARLVRLQRSLFDPERYTFEYDSDRTLTARQAFEARSGNCVSFVNLFIALARTQEILVRPAILRQVREVELEGDLLVVNTHLVAAYESAKRARIFDFYRSRSDVPVAVRLLDDYDLNAIYLNNVGVEKLRAGEFEGSIERFEAAVALSPEFAEAFANLGVARRRSGDDPGALDAYFAGLAVSPRNPRLLNNLTSLYRKRASVGADGSSGRPAGGEPVTAEEVMARADTDLALGNPERAMDLYKRAHRMDPTLAEPVVGVARLQILGGDFKAARKTLSRALEIDPDDAEAGELLRYLDRTEQ